MTTTFGTNASNDLYIAGDGNMVVDTGQQAVEDACATASKMRLGEGVLQTTAGMPIFQALFNGVPNPALYENALRTNLQAISGVANVTVIALVPEKNTFSYTAVIESIYGKEFILNG